MNGKYLWIARTAARSNLAYLGEVAARTLFLAVVLFIFMNLWRVTYGEMGATTLGSFTLPQMLWYLAMTEAITISRPRMSAEVDEDVRTGALAVQLVRPMRYPLFRASTTAGEIAVRFALNITLAVLIVLLLVGPIPFTPLGLLAFALSVPLAFALDLGAQLLIGLAAFWLENTSGLALLYSRLATILGGTLLPLDLFPEGLQRVLNWLPFAGMAYGPARLFVAPDLAFLADVLLRQGLFTLLLVLLIALVYRAALGRISANGG